MDANLELGLFNLWILFTLGYGIIWASMALANRKRGKPIEDPEDPELYKTPNGAQNLQMHGKW